MNTNAFHLDDDGKGYTAEASDIGLAPGEWPPTLTATIPGDVGPRSVVLHAPVMLYTGTGSDRELVMVKYFPVDPSVGFEFIVWND